MNHFIINIKQMKRITYNINQMLMKPIIMLLAFTTLIFVVSCKEDGPTQTEGEKIREAIVGTWSFSTAGIPTEAAAVISNPSVTISVSGSNATFISDQTSGLADFITGGAFTVNDDGTISSPIVNPATDSGLVISDITVSATVSEVVISFGAAPVGGRLDGVGTWTISFSVN
jgi:hypothetical protein